MKKKIMSLILMCCLCVVPFVFSGCSENYSGNQIISKYNTIRAGNETAQFFSGNHLTVSFNATNITNNANNINSPVYVLFNMYRPMLDASSQMFSSKVGLSSFAQTLDDISAGLRTIMYASLVELEENLIEFASIKRSFEAADNPNGNFLESLIYAYSDVLSSVIKLNTAFAEGYNETVISKRDYTSPNTVIVSSDVENIISYNKVLLTSIIFDYYVSGYSLSNPAAGFSAWQTEWAYFNNYITVMKKTYATGVDVSGKQGSLKPIMATLSNTYQNFITHKNLFEKSVNDFPYKDYYYKIVLRGENKAGYLKACTAQQKASYDLAANFIKNNFVARLNGISQLITYYSA